LANKNLSFISQSGYLMCCAYFLAQKNSVRTDDYFLPVP